MDSNIQRIHMMYNKDNTQLIRKRMVFSQCCWASCISINTKSEIFQSWNSTLYHEQMSVPGIMLISTWKLKTLGLLEYIIRRHFCDLDRNRILRIQKALITSVTELTNFTIWKLRNIMPHSGKCLQYILLTKVSYPEPRELSKSIRNRQTIQ